MPDSREVAIANAVDPERHARELARTAVCQHMVLTRTRPGSPIMVCGSCPLFFLMDGSKGVFIALRADMAPQLAEDLVGIKRLAEISSRVDLWTPNGPGEGVLG